MFNKRLKNCFEIQQVSKLEDTAQRSKWNGWRSGESTGDYEMACLYYQGPNYQGMLIITRPQLPGSSFLPLETKNS